MTNTVEFAIRLDPDGMIRGSKEAVSAWKASMRDLETAAKQTGQSIDAAYSNLGLRSFRQIRAEIKLVEASYRALEKSGKLSSQELSRAAKATQAKIRLLRKEMKATETQAGSMGASFAAAGKQLSVAMAAVFSSQTALRLIKITDEWNVLQQRIKTATKETGDYNAVSEDLYRITLRNGTAMRTTVSVFQSLARSAPELQATNSQILAVTEAVQQLGVISGASNAAMSAGLLQFSQALAAGVVKAEEMNSLLENIPEVANRIAKGMGLTVGELRTAVLAGEVLSKDVFEALLKQTGQIREEFESIPPSIERSINSLGTAFTKLLGEIDQTVGATSFIAERIENLTTKIDNSRGNLLLLAAQLTPVGDQVSSYLTNIYDEEELRRKSEVYLETIEKMKNAINDLDEQIGQRSYRAAALGPIDSEERRNLLEELDQLKQKREDLNWELQDYIQGLGKAKTAGVKSTKLTREEVVKLDKALESVGKKLKAQIDLYEKQKKAIEAAKENTEALADSFEDTRDLINSQGEEDTGPDIFDVQGLITEGKSLLNKGDAEGAVQAAQKARDAIEEMTAAGTQSRIVLLGLLSQAEHVGKSASKAIEKSLQESAKSTEASIGALLAEAENLKKLKIGFDEETAAKEAKTVRDNIQAFFAENPLEIPVEYVVKNPDGSIELKDAKETQAIPGKATGGHILGPGTETSDSILIRASRNEFMQPAASVRYYGLDVMERMRRRMIDPALLRKSILGYREGGLIRALPPSAQVLQAPKASQMGSSATVVLQLNGRSYTATTDSGTASQLAREAKLASAKGGRREL